MINQALAPGRGVSKEHVPPPNEARRRVLHLFTTLQDDALRMLLRDIYHPNQLPPESLAAPVHAMRDERANFATHEQTPTLSAVDTWSTDRGKGVFAV